MADYSKTIDRALRLANKRPFITIVLAVLVMIVVLSYFYGSLHKKEPSQNSVPCTGDKNQCAGTNDGTMRQDNH
jgi:hypothetical protein